MTVYVNSEKLVIPQEIRTIADLLTYMKIPSEGTGVGLNLHLVPSREWDVKELKEDDNIMIIKATYGG